MTTTVGEEADCVLRCNAYTPLLSFVFYDFDEVLKTESHYLEVIDEATSEIKLSLPFRKTHKYGGTI
jgi:hypothetical protein